MGPFSGGERPQRTAATDEAFSPSNRTKPAANEPGRFASRPRAIGNNRPSAICRIKPQQQCCEAFEDDNRLAMSCA